MIGSVASSVPEVNLFETFAQRWNTMNGFSATSCSAFEKTSSTDVGQMLEQMLGRDSTLSGEMWNCNLEKRKRNFCRQKEAISHQHNDKNVTE